MKRSVVVFSLAVFVLTAGAAAQQRPPGTATPAYPPELQLPTIDVMIAAQKKHEKAILALPGVLGIGITRGGRSLFFDVFVDQSLPRPPVPSTIEGITVRVQAVPKFVALSMMGTSTSNVNGCSSGTLGLQVIDSSSPSIGGYITNNHVAVANASGCPNSASIGTKQVTPSTGDNSCNIGTEAGKLRRFVTIDFAASAVNRVDAAFVEHSGLGTDGRVGCGICFPATNLIAPAAAVGLAVRKCGRTTTLTNGTVITMNFTGKVGYPCGTATFDQQLIVQQSNGSFSGPGDSGSVVFGAAGGVVGLLFAGNGAQTIVNPIGDVLSQLGVALGGVPSCTASGSDSANAGLSVNLSTPRLFFAPGGSEVLAALPNGTLLKLKAPGNSGRNLFALEKSSGAQWSNSACYSNLIGYQRFGTAIRDVDFVGGFTIVSLSDGRIVKVNGTGGSGDNMFAITTASHGFNSVPGFSHYVGSHKFRSGIASVTPASGELIVALDDGRLLKVTGTGGSGANVFAVNETTSDFTGVSGYNYYRGDQNLGSAVTAVAFTKGALFVATANGKILKVNGTGGSGDNMFAITSTSSGYNGMSGYNYYLGDTKLSAAAVSFLDAPNETLVAFADGRVLKVAGTGGTGHNMFAITDNGTSFSGLSGYNHYKGDQKLSSRVTAMAMIGTELVLGTTSGKMMKVKQTGGTGHNMFAVNEQPNGFSTVPGFSYLVGSTNLGAPISEIKSSHGFAWVGTSGGGNGKVLKVNGTGGTGLNMFAAAQNSTDFTSLCGFSYVAGSQGF